MEAALQSNERLMTLLFAVMERSEDEREEFLRSECGEDQDLYYDVLESLRWEERMGGFLQEPVFDLTSLATPFEPGQIVAERFEIRREIGEGGMGVVYEAFDRRRGQQVAIKAAKPGFQRLLSPELEGALTVRHHNVCLVNEIHTAQTQHGEIDFLTMELLRGETLSARLERLGHLEHGEALEIACQLCAGLSEAHRSGVIHGDLKSANVLLCTNADGTCRAVITDFGLASRSDTASPETGGTPGYMAPELWEGETASIASDVYALGAIFYEMVTGRMPCSSATNLQSLSSSKSLHLVRESRDHAAWAATKADAPLVPPSTWTHHLDPRWDRVIMPCLAACPAERPKNADEILKELRHEPIKKWPFVAAGLCLLLLTAVFGFVRPLRLWLVDSIWPPNVRLAVLPFHGPNNLTSVGSGVVQDLAERIQQLPTDRKWPLNKLSRTLAVIPPSRARDLGADTPERARDVLNATHALSVSLKPDGNGRLKAHAEIIDLRSQIVVDELSVPYESADVGNISPALTHFVGKAFRLRQPASEESVAPAAMNTYLNGLYLLNRDIHSFDEAMEQFEQTARIDPSSPLPPAGMALAMVQKFRSTQQAKYLDQAQQFVNIAQSRNPDSVRVLLASGRVHLENGHYNRALQDYQRIWALQPRNVDALLGLGRVYEKLEEPEEAINAFREAQNLDPEYYRSYQLLGEFYSHRGRYREGVDQFRKTVERAPGFFDGYSSLGAMFIELEQYDDAEKALQKSQQIRETAMALNNMGALRSFQHRYTEAASIQKRALQYQPNNSLWMLNIADNLRWGGKKGEAKVQYQKAQDATLEDITAHPSDTFARALYAYSSAQLRDSKTAKREIKEAINLAPGDNNVLRIAVWTYEALGERDLALEASAGMTAGELKLLIKQPDLADFCHDPRFKQEIADKGGQ